MSVDIRDWETTPPFSMA